MIQRVDDDAGIVRDLPHVDIRQVVVEAAQGVANRRRYAHRVGAGLLVDRESHAFRSVDADQVVDLAVDQLDAAEVRHAHGLLPPGIVAQVSDDDVAHVFHATKTGQGANLEDAVVLFQGAGRNVDVFLQQALFELSQRNAESVEAIAIHRDAHFALPPADHAHFGDPG